MENRNRHGQWLTYAAAMISVVLWAANLPATRFIMQYYSFGSLALFRFVVAALFLAAIAAKRNTPLPKKKDLPLIFLTGIAGVFLFTIFLNIGASMVVSGIASFIINSSPIFALLFTLILTKERMNKWCWIGVLVSFAGLMAVMIVQTAEFSFNIGLVLLLIAGTVYGLYHVLSRILFKSYTFFQATIFSLIAGTIFFFIFTPDLIRDWQSGFPFYIHIIVVVMGILPAAVANLSWGYALSTAEKTAHVTAFLYLTPFLATLIGFLWMGETFSLWALLGGAVIVGGMILTNTLGKSKKE